MSEESVPEEESQPTVEQKQQLTPVDTITTITVSPSDVRRKTGFDVSGTLRTSSGGAVSGMVVEIFINETKEHGGTKIGETTAQRGSFRAEVTLPSSMPRGPYQLLAHAIPNEQYLESWSDPDITVYSESGMQLTGPGEVAVDTQALFRGKVVDDTGSGVANQEVQVTIDGRDLPPQSTDQSGEFGFAQTFSEIGSHTIEVSLEGQDFLLGNAARLDITAVMPTALNVSIPGKVSVAESFPIEGQLLDARGNPVPGAEVTITVGDGPPWNVETRPDGAFETTGSTDILGDSVITAEFAGGYPVQPDTYSGSVTARYLTALTFSGPPSVLQDEEAVFSGRITSKSLPGIGPLDVQIEDRDGTTIDTVTTEVDGSFEYRSPGFDNTGPQVLTARFQEQERFTSSSASLSIVVVAPTVLTVEGPPVVSTGTTVELKGTLRTVDGQPVPGALVWVGDPESQPLVTDGDGAFGREFPLEFELNSSEIETTVNISFGFEGTDRLAPSIRNHAITVGVPWLSAEATEAVVRGENAALRGSVFMGNRPIHGAVVTADSGETSVTNETGAFVLQYAIPEDTPIGRNEVSLSVSDLNLQADIPVDVKSSVELVVLPTGDVQPGQEVILQATLYNDIGQRVSGATLQTGDGSEAVTDDSGTALFTVTVEDAEDLLAVPVTFTFEGDDFHVPFTYVAGIPITQAGFNWILWAGLPAIVVVLAASSIVASRWGAVLLPSGNPFRRGSGTTEKESEIVSTGSPEETAVPEEEPEPVPDPDPTTMSVSLERPASDLPFVWGIGELIQMLFTLSVEEGPAVSQATLAVQSPTGEQLSLTTDELGRSQFTWEADRLGDLTVSAEFEETSLHLPSSASVEIRVVDFREEIVRLYNSFVAWAEDKASRASGRTPRELESILMTSGLDLDFRAIDEIISRFEEADYSEHLISRRQYESMYRSWNAVVGE